MQTLTKNEEQELSNGARRERYLSPLVNIRETKDGYLLEAEMPGVNREGLEVLVENGELTLLGRRSDPSLPGDAVYRESRPLGFRRVFDLDPSIDAGRISAKIEHGVLKLTLPKTEAVKPRKITVE